MVAQRMGPQADRFTIDHRVGAALDMRHEEVAVAVGDDRYLPAAVPDTDDGAVDDQKPSGVVPAQKAQRDALEVGGSIQRRPGPGHGRRRMGQHGGRPRSLPLHRRGRQARGAVEAFDEAGLPALFRGGRQRGGKDARWLRCPGRGRRIERRQGGRGIGGPWRLEKREVRRQPVQQKGGIAQGKWREGVGSRSVPRRRVVS